MIRFTDAAVSDMARLKDFLSRESPQAAAQALEVVLSAINQLETFPSLGRPTRDPDIRQIFTRFGRSGYIIYYVPNFTTKVIVITRIWHSREDR